MSDDPGCQNVTGRIRARHNARMDRELARYTELTRIITAAEADLRRLKIRAQRVEREKTRKKFTREDLIGARVILTDFGWRTVVTVNAKTVSVTTGYSWVERVPFGKVLRAAG
jgi:type II secretory pathway component PulJ